MTSEHNSAQPRFWRLHKEFYRLEGEVCENCSEKIFPPRDICTACGKPAQLTDRLTGWGRIDSVVEFEQNGNGNKSRRAYARITLENGWIVAAEGKYSGPHTKVGAQVYVSFEKVKDSLKRIFRPSSQMAASRSSK